MSSVPRVFQTFIAVVVTFISVICCWVGFLTTDQLYPPLVNAINTAPYHSAEQLASAQQLQPLNLLSFGLKTVMGAISCIAVGGVWVWLFIRPWDKGYTTYETEEERREKDIFYQNLRWWER